MLMTQDKACLIISCMQKAFLPSLQHAQSLVDACLWCADFAATRGIPILIADHKNLGDPIAELTQFSTAHERIVVETFSILADVHARQTLEKTGRTQFLLIGAETHISILQSAFDLKADNKSCFVIRDAVSARSDLDHEAGLRRMQQQNIPLLTKEMFFFECLRRSTGPDYMDLSLKFLDQRYMHYR